MAFSQCHKLVLLVRDWEKLSTRHAQNAKDLVCSQNAKKSRYRFRLEWKMVRQHESEVLEMLDQEEDHLVILSLSLK